MSKFQTRRTISVSGKVYARARAFCAARGFALAAFVEQFLTKAMDKEERAGSVAGVAAPPKPWTVEVHHSGALAGWSCTCGRQGRGGFSPTGAVVAARLHAAAHRKHGDAVETSLPDMPRVIPAAPPVAAFAPAAAGTMKRGDAVPVERRPAPAAPPRQQPPLAKVPAVGRVAAPPTQEPSPGGRLHESERHGIAAPSSNGRMW